MSHKKHLSTASHYSPYFLTASLKMSFLSSAWAKRENRATHACAGLGVHAQDLTQDCAHTQTDIHTTWACMFAWILINPHWPQRTQSKINLFCFCFLLFVPSETTDHGSSKCDKWVAFWLVAQIKSSIFIHYQLNLTSNSLLSVLFFSCACFCVCVCVWVFVRFGSSASELCRRRRAKTRRTGGRSMPPWPWPTWRRGRTASLGPPAASSRSPPT